MEWTGARYSDNPTVEAATWIDADPQRVWSLVSDIELMPTLSNELQAVEWLDGASAARLGARFVGHNEHDAFGKWSTTSQIVAYDEPHEFCWAVGEPECPAATWRPSGMSMATAVPATSEATIVVSRLRREPTALRVRGSSPPAAVTT